jgi:hypothetical protein
MSNDPKFQEIKESQAERLRTYLDIHGSIDKFEAIDDLNIYSLPAVIQILRKKQRIHTYLNEHKTGIYILSAHTNHGYKPYMIHTEKYGLLTYSKIITKYPQLLIGGSK